jgi:3-oxoacyl-[acyl-carrier-protein] synthase-3
MKDANITGWGRYIPPLVMTNHDMAKIVDTSDEWIQSRSGITQRHYSHVSTGEMAWLAAEEALACAGMVAEDIDLVILGSTTPEEICPNTASLIKNKLGATRAAAFDLNSACTSWLYGLNVASDMIKTGSINNALVIGSERLSLAMDWNKRESCFLFGDGAGAVVLEAASNSSGLISSHLSCIPDSRSCLRLPGWGLSPKYFTGDISVSLDFAGQEIFKHAVRGMADAIDSVLNDCCMSADDIDLFVPHQANVRIIQALANRLNLPMEKVVVCIDKYANTSAAAIPIALCEALDDKRIEPGMTILTASFGAGLTCAAGIIKWGDRVCPLGVSDAHAEPHTGTVFDLLADSFNHHQIDVGHLSTKEIKS